MHKHTLNLSLSLSQRKVYRKEIGDTYGMSDEHCTPNASQPLDLSVSLGQSRLQLLTPPLVHALLSVSHMYKCKHKRERLPEYHASATQIHINSAKSSQIYHLKSFNSGSEHGIDKQGLCTACRNSTSLPRAQQMRAYKFHCTEQFYVGGVTI